MSETFMLYDYYKYFLNYLIHLYGGSYEVKGHILFMYSGNDVFKVSLLDGSRFDKFTFFHKNHVPYDGHFHKHIECRDLEFGISRCFTHSFNKENGIQYNKEDWKRFEKDALKYKNAEYLKEEINMEDDFASGCAVVLLSIAMIIFGPALCYFFGWITGHLLSWIIGDTIVNGMNYLFNTNRYTVDMLPTACGILVVIGYFFNSSMSTRSRGD